MARLTPIDPADTTRKAGEPLHAVDVARYPTLHKTVKIADLEIFYREAGPRGAPTILLLHGFPSSSHMFRALIPALSDQYHGPGVEPELAKRSSASRSSGADAL